MMLQTSWPIKKQTYKKGQKTNYTTNLYNCMGLFGASTESRNKASCEDVLLITTGQKLRVRNI